MAHPQGARNRSVGAGVFYFALAVFAITWSVVLTKIVIGTAGLPLAVLAGCAMSVGLAMSGAYGACKIVGEVILTKAPRPGGSRA
jgi:hypothetical protein